MADTSRTDFIRRLPKAELHLHIEGSFEPELMMQLAARNKIDLRFKTLDEAKAAYDFSNLAAADAELRDQPA